MAPCATRPCVLATGSGESMRGHQLLTPKTLHPACTNQNSRGGLWW